MKPRIFISSVSSELKSARQLVANTLLALGYEPVWQDIFGTGQGDLRQVLRDKIDSCEGLLQLVGDAYGAEPPHPDPEFGRVSYTQYEFWYARQSEKRTWIIFQEPGCTRDRPLTELDLPEVSDPRQPAHDALAYQADRRQWQAEYRNRLRTLGHLHHQAANDEQLRLKIRELKDELLDLRRGFLRWQRAVLLALGILLVLGGGLWATVFRQHADVKEQVRQGQQQLQQTIQETAAAQSQRIAAELGHLKPDDIKAALRKTIEVTHQQELDAAQQLTDWKQRDTARERAAREREKRLTLVDEFLSAITQTIKTGEASPEFLELTRIIQEQGVDEALAYVASQESRLLERAELLAADQQRELRRALAPLLEGARLQITRGDYAAARTQCEKLLNLDPQWPPALHAMFWSLSALGDRAWQYETLSDARPLYQSAHEFALRLADEQADHPQTLRDLSFSHNNLGDLARQAGQLPEALAHYQRGLEVAQKLVAAEPDNAEALGCLSLSYNNLGDISRQTGQTAQALEYFQHCLEIVQRQAEISPDDVQVRRDLSITHDKLGDSHRQEMQLEEALPYYQQGLEIRRKLAEADPHDLRTQRDLSVSYDRLGDASLQVNQFTEARNFYQQSLEIRQKLVAADSNDSQLQRELLVSYNKLGILCLSSGEIDEASRYFQSGGELAEKLAQADPSNAQAQRDLSISYEKLGDIDRRRAEPPLAPEKYQQALEIRRKLAAADPTDAQAQRDLMIIHFKLGETSLEQNEFAAAIEHYQQGIAVLDAMIEKRMSVVASTQEKTALEDRVRFCREQLTK